VALRREESKLFLLEVRVRLGLRSKCVSQISLSFYVRRKARLIEDKINSPPFFTQPFSLLLERRTVCTLDHRQGCVDCATCSVSIQGADEKGATCRVLPSSPC